MAHPASYIAYCFEKAQGPLTRAEVSWKDPQEGEVVLKVLACGMCGTDTIVQVGGLPSGFPRVPGHEIVGEIVATHPSVKDFTVGQRVGAGWQRDFCRKCSNCLSGKQMGCNELVKFTTGCACDGGLAQYVTIPTTGICPVPQDADPAEVAPLLCAGLTVYKAMSYNQVPAQSLVAIHGIGGLGHLAIQYSKAMGYRTVAISSTGSKKDVAVSLGADYYIDESTQDAVAELQKLGGAAEIVTTAPSSAAAWKMLDGLAFEGKLLVLSLPLDTGAPLSPSMLCTRRLSISGYLVGDADDCAETIVFSKKHGIKCMVETFPLDKAQEAFAHRSKAKFRAVVLPWA
ncbi:hypothetical protein PHLGIDRAFT_516955 [Phlebiopsis gigantea 11061_1 CR5-6]|uniref:Enoyl reductase (ER) domain-containing protein n=1 Tax=Phlebiopsis gigantea (strain 11061_1 CR5-6) TaxID=745531 RepID=A0A0C3S633_PHLG1|nr:hypothetical protein PHLGIDRAFT_516955 [Phlebiopsis gigantea 11061_1 CR5-6]